MNELIVTPLGTVSPYCYKNYNCPGFLISYKNQKYLLDAGNGISRYMNIPDDLDNLKVFITHLHPDHFEELSVLCQSVLVYKRLGILNNSLEIYIPHNNFQNNNMEAYNLIHSFERDYPVKVVDYDKLNIKLNDLKITSINVPHQVVANAFRIDTNNGSLVYSGDTGSQNNLREFAYNTDLLICESTYLDGQIRKYNTHLYAREAGLLAKDSNVKKLLLTHFWPHLSKKLYVDEAKECFKNTEYAEEGKKIILKKINKKI